MTSSKTICIIGTYDTKQAELGYIRSVIERDGGRVFAIDVSVLGNTGLAVDYTKHDVAAAAGSSIEEIIALGDESQAMDVMSRGACALATRLQQEGRFDGMISLGGTMGTDLALDVALALPLGVPKYIISTVAFSGLIPPERIAGDVQMILWAGGLYGLNSICRSALSQAAGAVLGAARAATGLVRERPLVGVSSLGNAALKYMRGLLPALEARGFEVAFFHAQGMGGRAMEDLAVQGRLVAVLDLCLQEVSNGVFGSVVSSGPERLQRVGLAGIPQIIAPGAADLVDWPTWQSVPEHLENRPFHVHNKLITSMAIDHEQRRHLAREIAGRLNRSVGPTTVVLPLHGIEEWDRAGEVAHDPAGLSSFFEELKSHLASEVEIVSIDAHINDQAFIDTVMEVFDRWVAEGLVPQAISSRDCETPSRVANLAG